MKKRVVLSLVLLLIVAGIYFCFTNIESKITGANTLEVKTFVQSSGEIGLYFCPQEDCEQALVQFLQSAENTIHCAMYEFDLKAAQEVVLQKQKQPEMDVKVITDNDYLYEFNYSFVKSDSWGLMHNKFCIIDGEKVYAGSMNPTENCAKKNNNNLLLITSPLLAQNYEDEFQEMWNGTFKKGAPIRNPQLRIGSIPVENYFCPEDQCQERVKAELNKAQQEIYFMTFSFTDESIGNELLLKKKDGLTVKGVMETRMVTEDSQFARFVHNGIETKKDGNPQTMHHKVFIIDNSTVITGSFNPTQNGNTRNDENVLIIHDREIAKRFLQEFEKVWEEGKE
ncbi:MAG: phospholipase D-like domain-containing protein [Candidatus Woesearchaeota archaeon]